MVEKYFLSLDFDNSHHAATVGMADLYFLKKEFGDAVNGRLGVKLNQDMFTGDIHPGFRQFTEAGYDVFADMKIAHGADTGERILDRIVKPYHGNLSVRYVTVSAGLGADILGDYVEAAKKRGIDVIAFTAHTKIRPERVREMYKGENMDEAVLNLGRQATEGGCHAMVLEAERLRNPRIRDIPIKKLVTGIRIDPKDAGTQSRVTALGELAELKDHVDYVVVSSKYLKDPKTLQAYFAALL